MTAPLYATCTCTCIHGICPLDERQQKHGVMTAWSLLLVEAPSREGRQTKQKPSGQAPSLHNTREGDASCKTLLCIAVFGMHGRKESVEGVSNEGRMCICRNMSEAHVCVHMVTRERMGHHRSQIKVLLQKAHRAVACKIT
jgi:hypothetical protein